MLVLEGALTCRIEARCANGLEAGAVVRMDQVGDRSGSRTVGWNSEDPFEFQRPAVLARDQVVDVNAELRGVSRETQLFLTLLGGSQCALQIVDVCGGYEPSFHLAATAQHREV